MDTIENKILDTADIEDIMKCLPHRYPFLLIDRVEQVDGDDFGIGVKNVTVNEPFFQGHFPGKPVMPGVLLIEGMAQAAGVMCVLGDIRAGDETERLVYFMTIDKCKFRKPVVPGDRVEYHMSKIKQRGNIWGYQGIAKVDGNKVAEAQVTAMIIDRASAL
jgi:3-hydroxyacyl-[acyl-carrier-protein] dehydratase